jgi:alpha-tubulin N-acetyltransferase 1
LIFKFILNFFFSRNFGSVVGILKVGAKHLYVYDSSGQVHERTSLCVLDFYVHESKQRLGYGKRLFDTMLEVNSTKFLYFSIILFFFVLI